MLLFQQMLVLFTYMLIGWAARRKGVFDERFGNQVSWLVLNVANPLMIVSSAVNGDGSVKGSELVMTAGLAVGIYALLLLLAAVVPKLFRLRDGEAGYFRLMTVFNNIGFMGFPVISAIYGSGALLYAAVFLLPYNLLFYTYGVNAVSRTRQKFQWRKVLNVGVIASILAVALYLTQAPVPQYVKSTAQGLSNLTAPLSMMVIGISLANMPLGKIFREKRLYVYILLRQVLVPIAIGWALKLLVKDVEMAGTFVLVIAMPVANMPLMLCEENGVDGTLLSKGIVLSTLFSLLAIPLAVYGAAL